MFTEKLMKSLKPLPFEPVFRYWVDKKGKRWSKPVITNDGRGGYVQKQERPAYDTVSLKKALKIKRSMKDKSPKTNVMKPGFMARFQQIRNKDGKIIKTIVHRT